MPDDPPTERPPADVESDNNGDDLEDLVPTFGESLLELGDDELERQAEKYLAEQERQYREPAEAYLRREENRYRTAAEEYLGFDRGDDGDGAEVDRGDD